MEHIYQFLAVFDPEIIFRLLVASALGAVIGFERDVHGRAAGLRTHLLVSLGAALFMVVSIEVSKLTPILSGSSAPRPDPGRIAAQVVTGIGFIGGGAILKDGVTIRGLTTAACLWVAAAIGLTCGAGLFPLAFFSTIVALFSLLGLNYAEKYYRKDYYRTLNLKTAGGVSVAELLEIIEGKGVKILHCDYERDFEQNEVQFKFFLRLFHRGLTHNLSQKLIDDVLAAEISLKSVSWNH